MASAASKNVPSAPPYIQLMENELLALWSADRKSVIFITHDLEEAISLSDRVVVMSAGAHRAW